MKSHRVDWHVLQAIRREGPIAQHHLAEKVGLRRSTVNGAARRLLEAGWLEKVGQESQGRGRPAILLMVRARWGYFVGVDLADGRCQAVVVDAGGQEVGRTEGGIGRERNPEAVVDQIELTVRGLFSRLGIETEKLLGLWVGVRGVIDDAGRVLTSAALGWHDVPLAELLRRRFDCELVIRGGASSQHACAEALIGAGRGGASMLYFQAADGVSARLVRGGQLLAGDSQRAGEIGHVIAEPAGRRCGCGNRGCLETVASGPALARALAEIPVRRIPPQVRPRLGAARIRRQGVRQLLRDFYGALPAGKEHPADKRADRVADRLAWGASLALAAYDPEVLVLGGYLFQDHPRIVRTFQRLLARYVMDWKARAIQVAVTQLGAEDRALGGAAEVCQRYWANPHQSDRTGFATAAAYV